MPSNCGFFEGEFADGWTCHPIRFRRYCSRQAAQNRTGQRFLTHFRSAGKRFLAVPELASLNTGNAVAPDIRSQYLEPLFQASPDALSISDCQHRVLWSNEAFSRMFGYDSQEVLGHPLEDLVVSPDRLPEALWLRESVAKGQSITLETQRKKKRRHPDPRRRLQRPPDCRGQDGGFYAGYHDHFRS